MKKRLARTIKWILLIFSIIIFFVFFVIFIFSILQSTKNASSSGTKKQDDTYLYHIMITGTYENKDFLEKVFKGADSIAKDYNAVVELHVPQSEADTNSIQRLLDYCSFLNVDGVIAYIDSTDKLPVMLKRTDVPAIPLVTIGQFSTELPQVSYIGSNYWEMGKKIADEARQIMHDNQTKNIIIISGQVNANSSNLINSLQLSLQHDPAVNIKVIESFSTESIFKYKISKNTDSAQYILISLSEEETIATAQISSEFGMDKQIKIIGFGSSEVCQLYLQKGWITELISLDPEKIGSAALTELFEYRNKGYANSYVTADVKITKSQKENDEFKNN